MIFPQLCVQCAVQQVHVVVSPSFLWSKPSMKTSHGVSLPVQHTLTADWQQLYNLNPNLIDCKVARSIMKCCAAVTAHWPPLHVSISMMAVRGRVVQTSILSLGCECSSQLVNCNILDTKPWMRLSQPFWQHRAQIKLQNCRPRMSFILSPSLSNLTSYS